MVSQPYEVTFLAFERRKVQGRGAVFGLACSIGKGALIFAEQVVLSGKHIA